MIIGAFTGALYAVMVILGVLLAGYGVALVGSFRAPRPKPAAKGAQPTFTPSPQAR